MSGEINEATMMKLSDNRNDQCRRGAALQASADGMSSCRQGVSFLRFVMLLMLVSFLTASCYTNKKKTHDAMPVNSDTPYDTAAYQRAMDSLTFSSMHHYSENYNFVVKADSLILLKQMPEEVVSHVAVDSFSVMKYEHLVVADIRIMPADSIDSVWVQLARDQYSFGWVHESQLLPKVMPDDPISQFISIFSDVHLLVFLIVIILIAVAYVMLLISRNKAKIVHFNDIVYPTLLALIVAASATLYASIQLFTPEIWRHFYYHPTLNPFSVPAILSMFLVLVWSMLIVGLACIDVVMHNLHIGDAVLYLCGLAAVCALNYIIFSLTTLYYIGYVLLVVYAYYALKTYKANSHCKYVCGHCGAMIHQKGRCPHCGTVNE